MSVKTGTFVLANYTSGFTNGPEDKYIAMRKVTLAGSTAEIDVSDIIRHGADVRYFLMKIDTVDSNGNVTITAAVPGATDEVVAAIEFNSYDVAPVGQT